MAKCWTCGSSVDGYQYSCSSCKDVLKKLENLRATTSLGFEELAIIQRDGFNRLSNQLSEISSVIEWGFGELIWQLQQLTDVLQSIDHTLKTPSETKANEWRLNAEELRTRGVLEESEEFFLKALNEYRLDYRIYVGLAETYLRMRNFDKAKVFLEKSLPHAPKGEIDCKSYSYRLIGHIYECKGDYNNAASVLKTAIELSPQYYEGHYDYAQYCAQIKNAKTSLYSLQIAILAKPFYWCLVQKERNFEPIGNEVKNILGEINDRASEKAKDSISKAAIALKKADEVVNIAKHELNNFGEKATLNSNSIYDNAKSKLFIAKNKVTSGVYPEILEAKLIADESINLANKTIDEAHKERIHYKKKRAKERREGVEFLIKSPFYFICCTLAGLIYGSIGGCTIGLFFGNSSQLAMIGLRLGIILSFIFFVFGVVCALNEIFRK